MTFESLGKTLTGNFKEKGFTWTNSCGVFSLCVLGCDKMPGNNSSLKKGGFIIV